MAKKKEKKEKKAGKRMSKKELAALLIDFFHAKPSETLSMKYIFSELHLTTHPQKMLCADLLHDLSDDDYISEIEKGKFRLNNHGTEMIGIFQRKSNGKNSFIPEGGGDPIFVAERNSAHAMNNDKVKITFYAKRKNKDAEGEVIEILERANDTFVGILSYGKPYACQRHLHPEREAERRKNRRQGNRESNRMAGQGKESYRTSDRHPRCSRRQYNRNARHPR